MMEENSERTLLFKVLMVLVALLGALYASVSHISESTGRWKVSFHWSDANGYLKSVSQC